MGQAHALISVIVPVTMLVVGLAMAVIVPNASLHPLATDRAAVAALLVGFGMFLAAKLSVIRRGRLVSMGSEPMSRGYRWLYRSGYSLMVLGLFLSVGSLAASRMVLRPEPSNTPYPERTGAAPGGGIEAPRPAGRSAPDR